MAVEWVQVYLEQWHRVWPLVLVLKLLTAQLDRCSVEVEADIKNNQLHLQLNPNNLLHQRTSLLPLVVELAKFLSKTFTNVCKNKMETLKLANFILTH